MRLTRFLAAVVLCGAAAGCGGPAARWLDPDPPPPTQEAAGGQTGRPNDPPPSRRNSLTMSADTVYFLEGVLPVNQFDGTTSALAGPLALRGQCHQGSLTVVVTGPAGPKRTKVTCDGRPHERSLGRVKVGDTLSVEATGRKGTDFALELLVR